ncbi:MAG: hypothetical protein KJ065_27325 [Anaerolineae bacterium]|nr:hypothetical protein [Anaerolineae bacterium]
MLQPVLLCPEEACEYELLEERAKSLLGQWIASRVDSEMLWTETSLGMKSSFEQWEAGFPISHGQFKAAMLRMGFTPTSADDDVWMFDRISTETTLDITS